MKLVVCKLEDGFGKVWYQIREKGWIFNSWMKEINFTLSGLSYYTLIRFDTESQAREYLKNYHRYKQKPKITELDK